jgi:hypothetical protein
MSHFARVTCLLVMFVIGGSTACPRFAVADDSQLPPFDYADARDADAPDPQYADGSPGQYVLIGSQWPQPSGKGTPITLTYSFQNMFDGALKMPNGQPLPASIIRGSIEEALHLWSSAAPINFVEVPDDGLSYGASTHYGQIRFSHIYINGPDPVIGDPVAKAQTYFPPGDGYPGDVQFDDSDAWQIVGTLRQPDVLGAAIHEIGHSLGLGHATGIIPGEYWSYQVYDGTGQVVDHLEPKGNADMFWIFNRYSGLGTGQLMPDDIAGIQAIYGAGQGSVTPLGVPEPTTVRLLIACAAALGMGGRGRRSRRASATNGLTNPEVFVMAIGYEIWRDQFGHSTGSGGRQQPAAAVPVSARNSANNTFTRQRKLVRLLGELDRLIEQTKLSLLQPIDDVGLARIFKQLDDMLRSRREVEAELGVVMASTISK